MYSQIKFDGSGSTSTEVGIMGFESSFAAKYSHSLGWVRLKLIAKDEEYD